MNDFNSHSSSFHAVVDGNGEVRNYLSYYRITKRGTLVSSLCSVNFPAVTCEKDVRKRKGTSQVEN